MLAPKLHKNDPCELIRFDDIGQFSKLTKSCIDCVSLLDVSGTVAPGRFRSTGSTNGP